MALQIQALAYLFVLIAGCGYAAVRGGAPERVGAALLFLAVIATNVVASIAVTRSQYTGLGELAVDIGFFMLLAALASRANRFWPIWAAAVQLDQVLTHIVMFRAATGPLSYAFTNWLFSMPLPLLIAMGVYRHRRRLRLHGEDRAWS